MRIKNLLLLPALVCAVQGRAQDTAGNKKNMVYVEQMPKAGYDYMQFLAKNIRYPEEAKKKNIEGRVVVKFVVNKDGSISDVSVLRGIGAGCDKEAKRVVSLFPKWQPGKQKGEPVSVYYTLPIVFKLTNDKN